MKTQYVELNEEGTPQFCAAMFEDDKNGSDTVTVIKPTTDHEVIKSRIEFLKRRGMVADSFNFFKEKDE